MPLSLIPIKETLAENDEFVRHPDFTDVVSMTVLFFARIGYSPPWIGYIASLDGMLVGSAAFKGRPMKGVVEIAYGTMPAYRQQGIGAEMCRMLVEMALQTDPSVTVTARTLREENFSTRILRKNSFIKTGVVKDPEDGKVWEWVYSPPRS